MENEADGNKTVSIRHLNPQMEHRRRRKPASASLLAVTINPFEQLRLLGIKDSFLDFISSFIYLFFKLKVVDARASSSARTFERSVSAP